MFPARIPFRQLVASAIRKRSMYNGMVVFAITLFGAALLPSHAKAGGACYAAWPRVRAMGAETFRLGALIRRTGDCSYLPKQIALFHQLRALALAGCVVETNKGMSDAQYVAKMRKYCWTNVAQKPQAPKVRPTESASQKPAKRQEIAKVQPETRPSKPSTQTPARVNENAQRLPTPTRQGRPLPVEAGARHLRPASAEAVPERSGTAPAPSDAALLERPTSPGPSNAQNSCSRGPGTPGCVAGSAPPTPQYFLTDSTPKPTPTPSLGGDVTAMEAIAASAAYFQNLQAYLATEDTLSAGATLSAGDGAIEAPAPSFEPIDLLAPAPGQYSSDILTDEEQKKLTEWGAEWAFGKLRDKPFEKMLEPMKKEVQVICGDVGAALATACLGPEATLPGYMAGSSVGGIVFDAVTGKIFEPATGVPNAEAPTTAPVQP
jgi:hypothetical protein